MLSGIKILTGLPDFQNPLHAPDLELYAPFGNGPCALLPRDIAIARNPDGSPEFQLQLIKRAGDVSPTGQYGVMDISLAGDFPVEDALAAARPAIPGATVAGVPVNSGFIRLYPTNDAVVLPAEMTTPVALGWAGSDFARWTMRLTVDSAELIRGALLNSALLFGARVEFDVIGVAPRAPVFVQFEPAKLIAALTKNAQGGPVSAADLLAAFTAPPGGLPYAVVGTVPDRALFAHAMTDRIIAAYGSLVPAPDITSPPCVALLPPADASGAVIQWDFSQPAAALRQWAMLLDPLTTLRAAAQANGLDKLVKVMAIPPLDLGFASIDFAANLPAQRIGVPAIGVNVQIPANPPGRPAAESATVMFAPPADRGTASLRLGPAEPLRYTVASFAMVATGHSVHRYDSPNRELDQPWVQLQPADFPVIFAHITAAARLLAVASIQGSLSYTMNAKPVQQIFILTAAQREIAVAAPSAAQDATLSMTATLLDKSVTVSMPTVGFHATSRVQLDFTSFAGYGPHRFAINCRMEAGDAPLFMEFASDEKLGDPAAVAAKFVFTPEQPGNSWGYVAQSPFRSGYRVRPAAASNEAPKPWSDVQSPSGTLLLDARGGIVQTGGAVAVPLATAAG